MKLPPLAEFIGSQFGLLTVVGIDPQNERSVLVKCKCGAERSDHAPENS